MINFHKKYFSTKSNNSDLFISMSPESNNSSNKKYYSKITNTKIENIDSSSFKELHMDQTLILKKKHELNIEYKDNVLKHTETYKNEVKISNINVEEIFSDINEIIINNKNNRTNITKYKIISESLSLFYENHPYLTIGGSIFIVFSGFYLFKWYFDENDNENFEMDNKNNISENKVSYNKLEVLDSNNNQENKIPSNNKIKELEQLDTNKLSKESKEILIYSAITIGIGLMIKIIK